MRLVLLSGITGWIASRVLLIVVLLPYLLRPGRLSRVFSKVPDSAAPYLRRMRPHYWLGYAAAAASMVHAWFPMQAGFARRTNAGGLWLATLALLLLFFQAGLGLILQDPAAKQRKALRNAHYWIMATVICLLTLHVWLNA